MIEEFVGYQFYIWWWYICHSSIFKDPFIEKGKESGGGGDGEMKPYSIWNHGTNIL